MITDVQFIAHWTVRVYEAETDTLGQWHYNITERFIPISEVSEPYNISAEWGKDAAKAMLGSNATDLLSSFAGYNVALDALVLEPRRLYSRVMSKDVPVAKGDTLMCVCPPPGR
ncbi:hypothetical protein [Sediminibacterium ginsengisoli]|uniref:Uncharacterized protein n=1 Tax=Sediminibacterium ginsengisoli TaxID=413434 RepID=A0A1T4RXR3_9BACT|nr:hypothetical protein [Sediminibacterium ginsengisoli]SKA20789.1 hypothetical protein SAMN04488132_11632 [Sediminibacterium ginsengisoli]